LPPSLGHILFHERGVACLEIKLKNAYKTDEVGNATTLNRQGASKREKGSNYGSKKNKKYCLRESFILRRNFNKIFRNNLNLP